MIQEIEYKDLNLPGIKLYDIEIDDDGEQIPVAVYLVQLGEDSYYYRCVLWECMKNQSTYNIDLGSEGQWSDIDHGGNEITEKIGAIIEERSK